MGKRADPAAKRVVVQAWAVRPVVPVGRPVRASAARS
jgi:hypothetical protein